MRETDPGKVLKVTYNVKIYQIVIYAVVGLTLIYLLVEINGDLSNNTIRVNFSVDQ